MKERPDFPEYLLTSKDQHLARAINMLEGCWYNQETGVVVAGLIDSNRQTYATSLYAGEGKWHHAKKRVLDDFTKKWGAPSKNAFVVVTMSPCTKASSSRVGEPCSNLLIENEINNIHIGHLDTKQTSTIDDLKRMGFDVTVAQNEIVRQKSKRLYEFFIENYKRARERGGNPWPEIKKESSSPFKL